MDIFNDLELPIHVIVGNDYERSIGMLAVYRKEHDLERGFKPIVYTNSNNFKVPSFKSFDGDYTKLPKGSIAFIDLADTNELYNDKASFCSKTIQSLLNVRENEYTLYFGVSDISKLNEHLLSIYNVRYNPSVKNGYQFIFHREKRSPTQVFKGCFPDTTNLTTYSNVKIYESYLNITPEIPIVNAKPSEDYSNIKVYYRDINDKRTSTTINYLLVEYFFSVVKKEDIDTEDKRVHLTHALQSYVDENNFTSKFHIEGSILKEIYDK